MGLKFCTEREMAEGYGEPSFHSFLITKEDGARMYGAVLTFYERVDSPEICAAMQTLQAMHMAELANAQSRTLYSHLGVDPVLDQSGGGGGGIGEDGRKTGSPVRRAIRPGSVSCGRVYDMRNDGLYCTKTMCILTPLPLISMFHQYLRTLHAAVMSDSTPELPMDSFVYNIIFEVPLPPPGRSLKFTTVGGKTIVCQRPSK